jgi:signal peptidase I
VGRLLRAVLLLLALAGVAVALVAFTSKLYRVPSPSMEPTLRCPKPTAGCRREEADRIAVSRYLYDLRDPHRGDVVAYRITALGAQLCGTRPNATFLHRIVGLAGERIATRGGVVFVNGKKLEEPYVKPDRRGGPAMPARRVPNDSYVVLGDNRTQSCDSRVWGYLPRKRIIGPVIATYWPWRRISIR